MSDLTFNIIMLILSCAAFIALSVIAIAYGYIGSVIIATILGVTFYIYIRRYIS